MPASRPLPERFWEKVDKRADDECWLWTAATNAQGYGNISSDLGRLAHRVSWQLHRGPIPNDIRVLHRCDVPACVNPAHLFLGTQADNMADMRAKGRGSILVPRDNRGARNPMATLSDAAVAEIRALLGSAPQHKIAQRFGIHQSQVSRIASGRRRKCPIE